VSVLDAVIVKDLAPRDLLGLELHLMESVALRDTAPVLVIYSLAGRIVSIGRYHFYDDPPERGGITVMRRLTGGRVVGAGEGWLGLALILPYRGALLAARDAHLKPDQVMNRYARGLLATFEAFKLKCFYPGRDAITLERRELAMCTFETDSAGAVLFEAAIAVNRGLEEVVRDLERADPDGQLPCAMYTPEAATRLVRELDRDIDSNEIARAIVAGYAASLGEVRLRELSAEEAAHGEHRGAALDASQWLIRRAIDLPLVAHAAGQLGAIEARVAVRDDGAIDGLKLAGDFIANSPGIVALERELNGARFDLPSVSRAVVKTYASGENYFLGIGDLSNLVQLIMKAA
jgi:lipoate-protein ligase A